MKIKRPKAPVRLGRQGTSGGHSDKGGQGDLRFGIAADPKQGVVHLDFGTPIAWIALQPEAARKLGQLLISEAHKLEKSAIEPEPS